jgi:tRNA (guanine37-N1)-methyltransferase
MQCEPIDRCITALKAERDYDEVIFTSPDGERFDQHMANELSLKGNLIILAGHYKGIDQRVRDHLITREISIGDFVMTGGEIPAMAVADAVCRLVPGVLSDPSCYENESHWNGMLEAPQYSRPEVWHDRAVPPILLSGHHVNVEKWRRKQSILRTKQRRPDLYEKLEFTSKEDKKLMAELKAEYPEEF